MRQYEDDKYQKIWLLKLKNIEMRKILRLKERTCWQPAAATRPPKNLWTNVPVITGNGFNF
jgi:hypothetical protein